MNVFLNIKLIAVKSKELFNWLALFQIEFLYSQGNIEEAEKLFKSITR